jgi:hypothetical protein
MKTTGFVHAFLFSLVLLVAASDTSVAAETYRLVPGESDLRVLVFRSGSLAGLGHNHIVSSRNLNGIVNAGDTAAASSIEILLAAESLVVDDPTIREEEGSAFSAETNEKDIKATRRNMMSRKLLDADRFEEIRIVSQHISGEFPEINVEAAITIKGAQHLVDLPAIVERYEDRIIASGSTEISHAELGLSRFTAAFGTMRVGEDMTFKYRIVARKIAATSEQQ